MLLQTYVIPNRYHVYILSLYVRLEQGSHVVRYSLVTVTAAYTALFPGFNLFRDFVLLDVTLQFSCQSRGWGVRMCIPRSHPHRLTLTKADSICETFSRCVFCQPQILPKHKYFFPEKLISPLFTFSVYTFWKNSFCSSCHHLVRWMSTKAQGRYCLYPQCLLSIRCGPPYSYSFLVGASKIFHLVTYCF